ncbi:thiamine phosphate synthase [Sporosarcina ureilytica]|uniref:Thiamine-phosphate synthase n=1 Tax=Sporosarcina ureilytica TaxID=298596 RepID=A0A1D8JCP1_9BACL|nr:thiamine phosphate synthase [Sporosarcina ureilytica]AOV06473.1 thiamine-phosphate diphosphorylase [Sporosarcina ureilytica]
MDKSKLQLYFIAGTTNLGDRNLLDVLQAALKGGITAFQLREKGEGALQGDALKTLAEQCKQLCNEYKVPFIVNDDVDLAIAVDADGVHIGQEDGDIAEVRKKIGSDKILGVSTHSVTDAMTASDAGANYVGVGPLFETASKENAGTPVGPELVRQVVNVLPGLPMVGIGGITERKAGRVIREGASGVAVISAIAHAKDVEQAARAMKGVITLASTGVEM